jgi:hypothetical protein
VYSLTELAICPHLRQGRMSATALEALEKADREVLKPSG